MVVETDTHSLVGITAAGEPAALPHRNSDGHASAVMQEKMGASELIQFKPIQFILLQSVRQLMLWYKCHTWCNPEKDES